MNNLLILILILAFFLLGPQAASAGSDEDDAEKQIVIALTTDDFELAETDISHLAVGESETIHTQSGKTIDLLRTEDGVEIYVDGELLNTGLPALGGHGHHELIHKHIEFVCNDDNDDCEELAWRSDGDFDLEALHGGDHGVIMIHKDGSDGEHEVIIEEDVDIHAGDHGRKVIVIRKTGEEI